MNSPRNINPRQQSRRIDSEKKLIQYIRTQLGEPLITVDVTDDAMSMLIDDAFRKFSDWIYNAQQTEVFVIQCRADVKDYILDDRVQSVLAASFADNLTGYSSGAGGSGGSNGMWGGLPMGNFMPPMYIPAIDLEGNQSSLMNSNFGNFCSSSYSASGVAGGVAGPNTGGDKNGSIEAAYAAMANRDTMANLFSNHISFDFNSSNNVLRIFKPFDGPCAIEAALFYEPNPEHDNAYSHTWIKEYSLNLVKRHWGHVVGKFDSPLIGGAQINYQRLIDEAQSELDRLNEELLERWTEPLGIFSS